MFSKPKEQNTEEKKEEKASIIEVGDFLRYGKQADMKLGRLLGRDTAFVSSVKSAIKEYNACFNRSYFFTKYMYSSTERSIAVLLTDVLLKMGAVNSNDKDYWAHKSVALYVGLLHTLNKTTPHSLLPLLAKYICKHDVRNARAANSAIAELDKHLDRVLESSEAKRSTGHQRRTMSASA